MTTAATAGLSTGQIAALAPAQVGALGSANIAAFTSTQLNTLSTGQIAALTAAQVAALPTTVLPSLSDIQLAAFSPSGAAGFSAASLGALTTEQIGVLTPAEFTGLGSAQVAALSERRVGGVDHRAAHRDLWQRRTRPEPRRLDDIATEPADRVATGQPPLRADRRAVSASRRSVDDGTAGGTQHRRGRRIVHRDGGGPGHQSRRQVSQAARFTRCVRTGGCPFDRRNCRTDHGAIRRYLLYGDLGAQHGADRGDQHRRYRGPDHPVIRRAIHRSAGRLLNGAIRRIAGNRCRGR